MVKSILKVLKKNQIHLKKAVVCVVAMALILQSLVYYGQNYTLDAKATENQRVNMTATTSGDAKTIPLNSSGTDSLKKDGLEADSEQGDSSGTDSTKEDGLVADSAQGDSSGTDSSTGTVEGSVTENSTGTGNDSAENQDATTSGDAKADDSETDATLEDDSDGKLDNLTTEITNTLLELGTEVTEGTPSLVAAGTEKMIYFYTSGNGGWNGWTKDCQIKIHFFGNQSIALTDMIQSSRQYTLNDKADGAVLWEYGPVNTSDYPSVIFTNASGWSNGGATETVSIDLTSGAWANASHPCFKLDGGSSGSKKTVYYLGDLGPLSKAGNTINFIDMTLSSSLTKVTAVFGGTGLSDKPVSMIKNQDGYYSVSIPEDFTDASGNKTAYETVKFRDSESNSLGGTYNFFNKTGTGISALAYEAGKNDTFYYGVTEQPNDVKVHTWGSLPAKKQLNGKILYFDNTILSGDWTFEVNGTQVELLSVNNANYKSYTFTDVPTAAQNTVLTLVSSDGNTKYHFMWNDIVNYNKVVLDSNIANVTGQYVKSGTRTIYFDATLSKLSYITTDPDAENTEADKSGAIPANTGSNVYYCAFNSKTSAVKPGTMEKEDGDVYKIENLDTGYDKICFANYTLTETNYDDYWGGGKKTILSEIPAALSNPCFYADTGDKSVYYLYESSGERGGYWQEKGQIRDPNEEKAQKDNTASADVVGIKTKTFTRDQQTKYISSTFYDYYSDYELNGGDRDEYAPANDWFSSYQTWYPFRQFDQALSDYYTGNQVKIPLYTGHFQARYVKYPNTNKEEEWGLQFRHIASTLDLYGWGDPISEPSKYNSFMSTNNSLMDVVGNWNPDANTDTDKDGEWDDIKGYYDYAAQGLVANELTSVIDGKYNSSIDGTVQSVTDTGGKVELPYFNKGFLEGDNSKKTVLGEVYENVSFPFKKQLLDSNGDIVTNGGDGVEYWYFDSRQTNLELKKDSKANSYYLDTTWESGGTDSNKTLNSDAGSTPQADNGFFPFNDSNQSGDASKLNYGYGAKLEFKFRLTEDGQITATDGLHKENIQFNFSGDDDVWVFIDGKLALDVGGAHGRVEGSLDFKNLTASVNKVKKSAGKTQESSTGTTVNLPQTPLVSKFTLEGKNTDEHTLTMFYMERGMWESNMKITFNFPDENKLEVEKQVNMENVNKIFQPCFDNTKVFTFHIRNLATHYGTKSVGSDTDDEEVTPIALDLTKTTLTKGYTGNTFKISSEENTGELQWLANMDDTTGGYREIRYGGIKINENVEGNKQVTNNNSQSVYSIDISKMKYLQFDFKYTPLTSTDTPSLAYMYVYMVDVYGRTQGINDYLSGRTYGAVTMKRNEWLTVKIDLAKLTKETGFDATKLSEIRFGYNYSRKIFLRNFVFSPGVKASELTGFTVNQEDVPDYGSAKSGKLEIPTGAKYTSSDGENYAIDGTGSFVLQNKEKVTFYDQFRRGSYIALWEDESLSTLFTTTWTMYEGETPVKEMTDGDNVDLDEDFLSGLEEKGLENVPGRVVNDGRLENVTETNPVTDQDSTYYNKYATGDAYRPEVAELTENKNSTFVFRSYEYPDGADSAAITKLKVVFNNKVKVGSLKITKAAAYTPDQTALTGDYTFKITYTNIGGLALETAPITQEITLEYGETYVITGIPLGTYYQIEEITQSDGATLDSVVIPDEDKMNAVYEADTKLVKGYITERNMETPTEFTFKNTKKSVVNVSLTKEWAKEYGEDQIKQPSSIWVQLQRILVDSNGSIVSGSTYGSVPSYPNPIEVKPKYDENGNVVWTYTITGLDKVEDYEKNMTTNEWKYQFVEVDPETKNVISEGGKVDFTIDETTQRFKVSYANTSTTIDGLTTYTTTITNTLLGPLDIELVKKSKDGATLSGVSFKLEKLTAEGEVDGSFTARTDSTDDYGTLTFADVPDGTYRLTETKAAEDYNLLKEPITIVLNRVGECTVNGTAYTVDEDGVITITIYNSKKLELPFTGGNGLLPLLLGGLVFTQMALLVYILPLRKKGGRKSRKRK